MDVGPKRDKGRFIYKIMSKIFSLNLSDWQKALIVAILAQPIAYIYSVVSSGSWDINWNNVLLTAVTGFLGYVIKNFFSTSDGKVLGRWG